MLHLGLRFAQELLVDDDEPTSFSKFIEGDVVHYFDDESDERAVIGHFSIVAVDVEAAVTERERLFDVFDANSKTIPYWDLYRSDARYKESVIRCLDGEHRWAPNLLILDRVEILPAFRHQLVGLRVIRWLCMRFATGCGLIAMKPFPLQYEGGSPQENAEKDDFVRYGLEEFTAGYEKALRKLQAHYARLGFKKVRGLPFMVADPYRSMPTLGELQIGRAVTGTNSGTKHKK